MKRAPVFCLIVLALFALVVSSCAPAPAAAPTTAPAAPQPTQAPAAISAPANPTAAPANPSPTAAAPATPVTLEVWDYSNPGPSEDWWAQFIKTYETQHPGTTVSRTAIPEKDYDQKLRTAIASNTEPDIFFLIAGSNVSDFADAKTIQPLDNLVDKSIWTPSLISSFTFQGALYAIPQYPYMLPLWYNTSMFQQNNIAVPKTWDDLLGACKTLRAAGKIPIALGLQERWELLIYYDYIVEQTAGPGMVEKAAAGQGASFTDKPFVDAATDLKQLVDNKCFPDGVGSLDQNAMASQFFNGQAAMMSNGPWTIGMAKSSAPADFKMGVFSFPALPNNVSGTEKDVVGGIDGFAISTHSSHAKEAADFLNAFGKANQSYSDTNGQLPAVPGITPKDPLLAQLATEIQNANILVVSGDRRVPAVLVDDYLNNVAGIGLGQVTPEQFGQNMANAVNTKVKK
jgi:raffinose/stachyose/melibiose transport system substrate-binding protein